MGGPLLADQLALLPLFAGATRDQIAAAADALHGEEASPGEVLGREGEPGRVFWLLLEGRMTVTARSSRGVRRLAEVGTGSLLGELALLRRRPRTATITAVEPCRFASGEEEAFARLLAIPPVRDRIRHLATTRLAADVRPVPTTMRDGTPVVLRPLLPTDRAALDSALHALSPQTIRRRFFSVSVPSKALIDYLVDIDYVDHFAWVLLDAATGRGLAVARYIRRPLHPEAEMAFTTIDSFQGRGVGTFLLGAVGVAALVARLDRLVAYVLEDNGAMRAVFAKAGGQTTYDEPGVLMVAVEPRRAAELVGDELRDEIAAAVHDVVSAASLTLT